MNIPNAIVDKILAHQAEKARDGGRPAYALFGIVAAVARYQKNGPVGLRQIAEVTGMTNQGVLDAARIGVTIGVLEVRQVGKWNRYVLPQMVNSLDQSDNPGSEVVKSVDNSLDHLGEPVNSVDQLPEEMPESGQVSRPLSDPDGQVNRPLAPISSVVPRAPARGLGTHEEFIKPVEHVPPPLTPPGPTHGQREERQERSVNDWFEEWWRVYPQGPLQLKAGQKQKARSAFEKLVPPDQYAELIVVTIRYAATKDPQFYKAPVNFLSDNYWRDLLEPVQMPSPEVEKRNGFKTKTERNVSRISEIDDEIEQLRSYGGGSARPALDDSPRRALGDGTGDAGEDRARPDPPRVGGDHGRNTGEPAARVVHFRDARTR